MTGAAGTKIEEDIEDQWVFPREELTDDEKKANPNMESC